MTPIQEDQCLQTRVAKYGTKSWTNIASGVEGRSAKSCRLRCASLVADIRCSTRTFIGPSCGPMPHYMLGKLIEWACRVVLELTGVFLCMFRWYNQLCPGVKRTPFSDWEQAVIIKVN